MRYLEVYAHGVGSSCGGDQYRHEVLHLAEGHITLCGTKIRGRDWWRESSARPSWFKSTEGGDGETRICKRCSKKFLKED